VGEATDIRSNEPVPRTPSFAGVRVGHLVEVRLRRLSHLSDVESLSATVLAAVTRASPGAVICADFRRGSPLSAQVASQWCRDMRRANGLVRRSGILLDPSNTVFNLQLARVVRCAGSDARRLFTDPRALYDWAVHGLSETEREDLRDLLSELCPAACPA
jgi:hypothetical protein